VLVRRRLTMALILSSETSLDSNGVQYVSRLYDITGPSAEIMVLPANEKRINSWLGFFGPSGPAAFPELFGLWDCSEWWSRVIGFSCEIQTFAPPIVDFVARFYTLGAESLIRLESLSYIFSDDPILRVIEYNDKNGIFGMGSNNASYAYRTTTFSSLAAFTRVRILPGDTTRVAVVLVPSANANLSLFYRDSAETIFARTPFVESLTLELRDYGPLIQGEVWLETNVAFLDVNVVELFRQKKTA
jgi:hypothetical protein